MDYTLPPTTLPEEQVGGELDASGDARASIIGRLGGLGRRFTLLRQTFSQSIPRRFSMRRPSSRLPSSAAAVAAAASAAVAAAAKRGSGSGSGPSTSPTPASPMSPLISGHELEQARAAAGEGGDGGRGHHRTPTLSSSARVQYEHSNSINSLPATPPAAAQTLTGSVAGAAASTVQSAEFSDKDFPQANHLRGSWRRKQLENATSHISPLSPPAAHRSSIRSTKFPI